MENLVKIVLLNLALIYELITDWHRIRIEKREDNHKPDVLVRGSIIVVMAFITAHFFSQFTFMEDFIRYIMFSVCIFIAFFNYTINIITDKPITSLRNEGTDKYLKRLPWWGALLVYGWFLFVGVLILFYWENVKRFS